MGELDKAQNLAKRLQQRQQILALLDTFSGFTDRSLMQMARLRSRFLAVAGIDNQAKVAAFLAESAEQFRRLGEKATSVQSSLIAAALTTDNVLAHPEKLAEALDNEEIDQALEKSLTDVIQARLDLQAQVLVLDAIADEVDRLL